MASESTCSRTAPDYGRCVLIQRVTNGRQACQPLFIGQAHCGKPFGSAALIQFGVWQSAQVSRRPTVAAITPFETNVNLPQRRFTLPSLFGQSYPGHLTG